MNKTLVIGSCTVDIIIPSPRLPSSTDSVITEDHHISLGGCANNVAEALRISGAPYLHAFTLGSGIYGEYAKSELARKGLKPFRTSPDPHGACICIVEPDGERSFMAYHGVEYTFRGEWLDGVELSEFTQAYICGLELEVDDEDEIVRFLERSCIRDIYFAPGPRLMTLKKERLSRLMALSPIIHLNDKELTDYTGVGDIAEAVKILSSESHNDVIVTLGPEGSLVYSDGIITRHAGEKTVAVDTVGAGDCHLGTYMACRARGYDRLSSLRVADHIASRVIMVHGPTLDDSDVSEEDYR